MPSSKRKRIAAGLLRKPVTVDLHDAQIGLFQVDKTLEYELSYYLRTGGYFISRRLREHFSDWARKVTLDRIIRIRIQRGSHASRDGSVSNN